MIIIILVKGVIFQCLCCKFLTVQSIMGPFTKYAMLDHFTHFIFITRYAGMGRGGGGGATIIYWQNNLLNDK
jgi:hypothetical protein